MTEAQNLDTASEALQRTIDLLNEIQDLDELIPRVLEIVSDIFRARSCAFYEHGPAGMGWLRYWNTEHRTFLPCELLDLDPQKFALVRKLAEGFEVSDAYLGMPTERIGTVQLDHVQGTSVPEFDRFAIATGWELELNIGVGSGGVRDTTLCIFREQARRFESGEIALAESIAKQVGFAWRFSRLANQLREEAKLSAVALEREAVAESRAAELALSNASLSRGVAAVSDSPDFNAALEAVFNEVIVASDACAGHLFEYREKSNTLKTLLWVDEQGRGVGPCPHAPPVLRAEFDADITSAFRLCVSTNDIFGGDLVNLTESDRQVAWPGVPEWHIANGRTCACAIPIIIGQRCIGVVGLAWKQLVSFSPEKRELLFGLTNQIAMILELERLAESRQRAMVARERELETLARLKLAEDVNTAIRREVEEREKVEAAIREHNELMVDVLNRVSTKSSPEEQLASIFGALVERLEAHSASLFLHDELGDCTVCHGRFQDGGYRYTLHDDSQMLHMDVWDSIYLEELKTGKILIHGEEVLSSSAGYRSYRDFYKTEGIRSIVVVPMFSDLGFHGFFSLRGRRADTFNLVSHEFLHVMADQVMLAARIFSLAEMAEQATVSAERTRIARDLHDSVAQGFAGVILHLEAAGGALDLQKHEAAARHIAEAGQAARFGLAEARRCVYALREDGAVGTSLVTELDRWIRPHTESAGIDLQVVESGVPFEVDPIAADVMLRIGREITTNVLRHSKANCLEVGICFAEPALTIEFRDNGIGFDLSKAVGGFGLAGIRERAIAIGCTVSVSTSPGCGTAYLLHFPGNTKTS